MKKKRRDFLKHAGLVGAGMMIGTGQASSKKPFPQNPFPPTHNQRFNMHGYAAPKLETVRVGFVGVGSRGSGTVQRLASIEGVQIKAICDFKYPTLLPVRGRPISGEWIFHFKMEAQQS